MSAHILIKLDEDADGVDAGEGNARGGENADARSNGHQLAGLVLSNLSISPNVAIDMNPRAYSLRQMNAPSS